MEELAGSIDITCKPHIGMLRIGFSSVGIFDKNSEKSIWRNKGMIILKGRASLGQGSRIENWGRLEIGDNFIISANSSIICADGVFLGSDVLISWDVLIMDTDQHNIYDSDGAVINLSRKIVIGDHVWVGCRSTILKGSHIEKGNVIAAGSIIHGKVLFQNSIVTGDKVLHDDIRWEE